MPIGCHISIRHGYLGAARTAAAIGAGAFQYFPKNPRSLAIKAFDRKDAEACAQFCRDKKLLSIAHSPYPVNLAAAPSDLRRVTVASLKNDLEIVEACGSIGLVVHFGKWKGSDLLEGYKYIIDTLDQVLADWEGEALILLENQAGEGLSMGTTLEELTQIRNLTEKPHKIGFCLDTCHSFASGLWTGTNTLELEQKAKKLGFLPHLRAVHLNDSAYPKLSGKDRHANIGRGHIGEEGFRGLFKRPWFRELPLILETPAGQNGSHEDEIRKVKSLFADLNVAKSNGKKSRGKLQ
jgi:deoxyribonuclease-4